MRISRLRERQREAICGVQCSYTAKERHYLTTSGPDDIPWLLKRPPKCNRTLGHPGPHREYRRRDFAVLAEFSDDHVAQVQPRRWAAKK